MKVKNLINKIKHFVFALKWTCNICGKEIFNNEYYCDECKSKLKPITSIKCDHCGRLTSNPTLYCESCSVVNQNIDTARSVYAYNETIAKIIYNFKYSSKTYIKDIFAEELSRVYLNNFFVSDYLTYIPMTKERLNDRGYNQSKLMADKLSEILSVPSIELVEKVYETERQATLTANERKDNLKGSFKGKNIDLKGKTVTVIDDVLTTGVTMDLVAEQLKKMGASKVYALTVASVGKKIDDING